MITLITGTPGAGKTAYAVKLLMELQEREAKEGKPPRPVIIMGIPELMLPHDVAPPVEEWTERVPTAEDASIEEAVFTFPDGALVIVDECQKVWRNRARTSKVPDTVAAFEKHRHKGLDFWLITQSYTLIDPNVSELVGKHIHLRATWAGRRLYEWPEVTNPDSPTNRGMAAAVRYTLPKNVFGVYRSASMHVKQSRRIPIAVWVFLAAIGIALYFGSKFYGMMGKWTSGQTTSEAERRVPEPSRVPFSQSGQGQAVDRQAQAQVRSVGAGVEDYVPRISTRPETAPMYDSVRQVKVMPIVAGCVSMGDRCSCYTQQGTDAFLEEAQCRELLRKPPFNPWQDQQQVVAATAKSSLPVQGM
ncbi:zonular occludens toxin [Azoarcus indigens]|uniref:Zona occludens toxin n=1 Tax=Azoarcus indigens TaxID=29545 RepID=A0A4R6DRQ1_9RHOO|nr:zonular occludens toxin domain-containing protein [Azoarcus indigens]NMG66809.1 zonular occludens toxin [Azoarcus indigens]TDN46978.1 zona occludens toxin [Azoarcus indigens]